MSEDLSLSHPSSYRDPSGFIFVKDKTIYRQINHFYKDNYELAKSLELFEYLQDKHFLVEHEEVEMEALSPEGYKVIRPKPISFWTYPYEWSFTELKDAALLTLQVTREALNRGMILKDANPFNIQFYEGKPLLIDTLSFDKYQEGKPWVAYRQFCELFLGPLLLMRHVDLRMIGFLRIFLEGIPLEVVSRLLPLRTRFSLSCLMHIHGHAKSQRKYSDKPVKQTAMKMSKLSLLGLLDSLESYVSKLSLKPLKTEWVNYYNETNYSESSFQQKEQFLQEILKEVKPKTVWDLGANTGHFSKMAAAKGAFTVAMDIDPGCVENLYLDLKKNEYKNIVPLLMDLTNPTPSLGWQNAERENLASRGPVQLIIAFALVHHLAIGKNLPLHKIAEFLSETTTHLLIEFVPKEDSQAQKLLRSREDVFDHYDEASFEKVMKNYFKLVKKISIQGSKRSLYWYEREMNSV